METILCHIVGLNPFNKIEFSKLINNNFYNIIDLDEYNQDIFKNEELIKLFNKYEFFKKSKNDKYKDIERKINTFWEEQMINFISQNVTSKKKTIIIGYNNHFRNVSKKINIETNNKFIIESSKKDIRKIIEYNLEKYKKEIIYGVYSLNNINHDILTKSKKKLESSYKKNGYICKTFDQIKKIISLLDKNNMNEEGLWICSKQPYNLNSKIHPTKNNKIFGYIEPMHALISSFNWNEDELIKSYQGKKLKLIPKDKNCFNKLKQKRFLYYVDTDTFIPYEKGNNIKFCSQVPVRILEIERIDNVYKKFKKLGFLENQI